MPENVPVNHHYVPAGYLRNFTDARGALHLHSKKRGTGHYPVKPTETARERHFHTQEWRADPAGLERRLDRDFESRLLPVVSGVIGRVRLHQAGLTGVQVLPEDDRLALAQFTALQMIRTRQTRDVVDRIAAEHWDPQLSLSREAFTRIGHLKVLEEHLDTNLMNLTRFLMRHAAVLLTTTPQQPFHTSDHPVMIMRGTPEGSAFWGGVGLMEPNLELNLPLSRDVTLVFVGAHLSMETGSVHAMRPDAVPERNEMVFHGAHELVFAPEPIVPPGEPGNRRPRGKNRARNP